MKEERKEKIIKESHREYELKTRLLANRKRDFRERCAALGSTLR